MSQGYENNSELISVLKKVIDFKEVGSLSGERGKKVFLEEVTFKLSSAS